ncbi:MULTISPECIES: hypothetical protein [Streptomyces]|uniref:Uncharacterized protein n=1 Tax=Streptomyces solicathayae TaxID=3081768 RepID=A0ABZ0LX65_9ACTN|nr:hypothetical protein [Streptomyces sp. HUAS YS2]WOX24112.1 hypothetical protein R2D22_23115 [Streptomyces sp. HUAS YS2]
MHSDIHLTLHEMRAADLRQEAAGALPRTSVRVQLGWKLVEWGLRLATPEPRRVVLAA